MKDAKNVLGTKLEDCSLNPMTGFYRTGCCDTGEEDRGLHVVCCRVTDEFLTFSKTVGNDLSTARPEFSFVGLKAGDQWCLCAARWQEALVNKVAPPVVLKATHEKALDVIALEDLMTHAITEHLN